MRRILFLFLLFSNLCFSQDSTEISILTCSPGDEVYSVFGHTAIRIVDQEHGVEQIINFGMFNFDTPNFALKFVNGRLKYHRGIQDLAEFIQVYNYENRLVSEQKLDLSEEEINLFLGELRILFKPENREYVYSFLERNCSTETRDLLKDIGVVYPERDLDVSHRELINSYLTNKPWIRFGTDLLLGMPVDEQSSLHQSMFLPDYLERGIDSAKIKGKELVKSRQVLNTVTKSHTFNWEKLISPLLIFSLLLIILLIRFPRWAEIGITTVTGLVGTILVLLWLFSAHPEVKNNLNVLWCNPLYLLYIPLILRKKSNKILTYTLSAMLIASMFVWILGVQSFDIGVIPILGILGLINFRRLGLLKLNKI